MQALCKLKQAMSMQALRKLKQAMNMQTYIS